MNILHFNTYDTGGSANAVFRFHRLLKTNGYNSKVVVFKNRVLKDADYLPFQMNGTQKLRHYLNETIRRIKRNRAKPEYNFFNIDEQIGFPTSYFLKQLPFQPDAIFIHWVSGFVTARNISELGTATGAPVYWRFNDMNAFTGGCHYNNGCLQYTTGCGTCPAFGSKRPADRSYKNYREKIKWLGKTDITFISSTTQIDAELKSSLLAKYCKTKKILLSVGNHFFKPGNKTEAAKSLGLPLNKRILFFGAQTILDPRKGFKELLMALHMVKKQIPAPMGEEILLVYASKDKIPEIEIPFAMVKLPFLPNEETLARAYQAATVFLSPSIEDAGPMMLAEAMLCGTPVVAYETGLAKDAILNNLTGFMVAPGNIDKFAEAIVTVLGMPPETYRDVSENCAAAASQIFSEQREWNEYQKLLTDV
jgi:glycosyltransferase involved in cell wall biosynthesis